MPLSMERVNFVIINGLCNQYKDEAPALRGLLVLMDQRQLEYSNLGCLQALRALLDGEFDLLAFLQAAKTITDDRGEVNENIVSFITLDEAVAFSIVEPFDRTDFTI